MSDSIMDVPATSVCEVPERDLEDRYDPKRMASDFSGNAKCNTIVCEPRV